MTTKRSPLLAILLTTALAIAPVATPAAAQRPAAALAPTTPEQVGFSTERLKKLDAFVAQAVADGEVVGATTLLARHGKLVSFNTYGEAAAGRPMAKDALFRIYSMSKPITGVAMMILFEEGKWKLDDPVTKFVPEFKDLKVITGIDVNGKPILANAKRAPTMREVMSHTAGFGYGLGDQHYVDKLYREKGVLTANGMKDMIDRTATIPLMFQPGENWSYSSAVDIQGAIVERISGQKFSDFLSDRIFKPLKMNDTFFTVPADKVSRLTTPYEYSAAAQKLIPTTTRYGRPLPSFTTPPPLESGGGGLVSTTTDYARFAQMVGNGGVLDGARILSPAAIELMGTNVIPKNVLVNTDGRGGTGARFNEAVGFGLDFMTLIDARKSGSLEGDGTMSWGGAAGTWFWVDPTNDIIFVGMIQRYIGKPDAKDLSGGTRTLVYQALLDPKK